MKKQRRISPALLPKGIDGDLSSLLKFQTQILISGPPLQI
jgi:hypothetical protein